MMPVKLEGIRLLSHSAFINDCLAVVLAGRLQSVELEQAIGGPMIQSGSTPDSCRA